MSKKKDPLNAKWDSLADFRDQYITRSSDEKVVESQGHTLVTDKANYYMDAGRVRRVEHPYVEVAIEPKKRKKSPPKVDVVLPKKAKKPVKKKVTASKTAKKPKA